MLCAAALFAACSSTDELEPVVQTGQQTAEEAVGFDVYTRGTTRAGYVGEIDATAFQVTGFGVYAYVTSGANYAAGNWTAKKASAKPDFMANQHVTYSGGWTYSPVKYWPNQANTTTNGVDNLGGGSATNNGTNIDYVSFFAYAPYVDDTTLPHTGADGFTTATGATAITNTTNTGIIWLPANNTLDDPKVVYRMAADPTNAVDLMYGVAARAYTVNETTGQQGTAVEAGKPFLDMTKEVVADKLNYRFQHALTKLAVNVDAYFDEVRNGSTPGTNDVDPNTRIVIKDVVITTDKLAVHGTMNLNNGTANTPNWTIDDKAKIASTSGSYNSGNGYKLPVTSGLLHVSGGEGTDAYFAQQPLGVTKTKQPLMGYAVDGTTPASLMFVPNTAGTSGLDIVITYKVITRDARLKDTYSEVTNVIKQTIAVGDLKFNPGYSTVLNLHLGMTSVKMDAVISAWDGTDTKEVDLPANVATIVPALSAPVNSYGNTNLGVTATKVTKVGEAGTDVTSSAAFAFTAATGVTGVTFETDKFTSISPNYTNTERFLGTLKATENGIDGAIAVSQPRMVLTADAPNAAATDVKTIVKVNGTAYTDAFSSGSDLTVTIPGLEVSGADIDAAQIPANTTGAARQVTIIVTHTNGFSETITVTQPAS